ncbi:hypothetical protein EPUL_006678, partial [Erysiphe pulchra]
FNETAIRAESTDPIASAYLTDRKFHERIQTSRQNSSHNHLSHNNTLPNSNPKKCFVCRQVGCWSTNHSQQERTNARVRFTKALKAYVLQHDHSGDNENMNDTEALILVIDEYSIHDNQFNSDPNCFYTSISKVTAQDAKNRFQVLANQSTYHTLTHDHLNSDHFLVNNRYSSERFHGIMLDTGASYSSIAGFGQVQAYIAEFNACMDTSSTGNLCAKFGVGESKSIGIINVSSPIGPIKFYVIEADTPFLLCLQDMDKLGIFFNNTTDTIETHNQSIPIVRKFGHPFLVWGHESMNFLTETELRQLHRRFGHPPVNRLV